VENIAYWSFLTIFFVGAFNINFEQKNMSQFRQQVESILNFFEHLSNSNVHI
jgi:hypothetical protein